MLRHALRHNISPQTQLHYQAQYAATHHVTLAQAASHTTPCGPNNGAGFLFIPDLTDKATGWVLIVLLVLYVGSQLASSLMMSTPMMDKNQQRLMMLLPLFFVVIVINFPAGLLVYWITTNVWTMGQQYVVKRMVGPPTPAPALAGPEGGVAAGVANGAGGSGGGLTGLLRGRIRG